MNKRLIITIIILALATLTASAQQKQGHVRRPRPRGVVRSRRPRAPRPVVVRRIAPIPNPSPREGNAAQGNPPLLSGGEGGGLGSGQFPITKRKYDGFHKDSRTHIYKLQVAANCDHLKTAGARDPRTGALKSHPSPYEPLEKE